jgi:hypothetical protein
MFSSYHTDRSKGYNEVNPGVEIGFNDTYVVGFYENSKSLHERENRRFTGYAGFSAEKKIFRYVSIGLGYGLASGYGKMWENVGILKDAHIAYPFPFCIPNMQVGTSDVSLATHVIAGTNLTFGFQFRFSFNE